MANWATVAALGDPSTPQWQAENLSWIEPIKGQRWQVYKPAAAAFEGLLTDLAQLGYNPISSGGYNYRNIRGGDQLSQHAFGTAIDLNAMTNPRGQSATDIPHAAELARKHGLEWGGLWSNPDPMHFEYTGGGQPAGGALSPQQQWASQLWPMAQAVAQQTGLDPRLIMAQTALETGWGKSVPNMNYFGVKGAGPAQKTLEFIGGRMQPVEASFAGYKNPQESFDAYQRLMLGERYAGVRSAQGLEAQIAALGKSGYATDPDYAAKILDIAQDIPAGGYQSSQPPLSLSGIGSPGDKPLSSPYALPKEKPKTWGQKIAGALSQGLGDIAMGGGNWQAPQMPAQPGAANVQAQPRPAFDPAASEMQRQRLALAMQRLNQGVLF
jgi:hypothetical protein